MSCEAVQAVLSPCADQRERPSLAKKVNFAEMRAREIEADFAHLPMDPYMLAPSVREECGVSKLKTKALLSVMLLAGAVIGGAASPAADGTILVETALAGPSDSHEPQRVLMVLRNLAPDRIRDVIVLCDFTGPDGSVLETTTVSVGEIPVGEEVRATAIYYGWPRASGAGRRSCH